MTRRARASGAVHPQLVELADQRVDGRLDCGEPFPVSKLSALDAVDGEPVGSRSSSRPSSTASATPSACVEERKTSIGSGPAVASKRWSVPGSAPVLTASTISASLTSAQSSISIGSPSSSRIRSSGMGGAEAEATSRPAPSSPRKRLPTPIRASHVDSPWVRGFSEIPSPCAFCRAASMSCWSWSRSRSIRCNASKPRVPALPPAPHAGTPDWSAAAPDWMKCFIEPIYARSTSSLRKWVAQEMQGS